MLCCMIGHHARGIRRCRPDDALELRPFGQHENRTLPAPPADELEAERELAGAAQGHRDDGQAEVRAGGDAFRRRW